MKVFKRIFSILILVIIIGGVGYYFYTEQIKGGAPDIVAKDTGSIDLSKIEQTDDSKTDSKTTDEGKYTEEFESWDALDDKAKDGIYTLDKYPDKTLYLISATKQADGKIMAVFDDEPIKDK
ncbi:hypothetical protein [Vagococcus bubulae]|uniref:Uncharacterized protein n=1 Tax=Vagococcus bubulae TaxID=1977868 RepID=A0A429ZR51_9ENTE|nr:hypothetical protein [Vagococcus bubulae]RST96204.1 hypothetical protein CBF36_00285 [Vagococcus bubulae]